MFLNLIPRQISTVLQILAAETWVSKQTDDEPFYFYRL